MKNNTEIFLQILATDQWAMKEILIEFLDWQLQGNRIPEDAQQLFFHNLFAYTVWYNRIHGLPIPNRLEFENQELSAANELISTTFAQWTAYLSDLSENDAPVFEYQNLTGQKCSNTLEDILIHISHHSCYHRGQIQRAMKSAGCKLRATDFIIFNRKMLD